MSSHTYIHRGELQKRWMTSVEINNKQMVSVSIHHVFRSRLLDRIFFSLPRFCAFRKYYKRTEWSFLRYLSFCIVEGLKLTCVQYNVREVSSKFSTLLLSSVQKSERTKTRSIVQEFAVLRVNSIHGGTDPKMVGVATFFRHLSYQLFSQQTYNTLSNISSRLAHKIYSITTFVRTCQNSLYTKT